MALLVYVNDMILAGNDLVLCASFKQYLNKCFHIKDLGALKYFLGIEVVRNSQGLFLCQQKYVLDIISECELLGSKPTDSPMQVNHKLAMAAGAPLSDATRYQRLVGRLIYLTFTCFELSYAVYILCQYMQAPKEDHLDAARRVR